MIVSMTMGTGSYGATIVIGRKNPTPRGSGFTDFFRGEIHNREENDI